MHILPSGELNVILRLIVTIIKPNSPRVIYQFRIDNERTDLQSASVSSIVNVTTLATSRLHP